MPNSLGTRRRLRAYFSRSAAQEEYEAQFKYVDMEKRKMEENAIAMQKKEFNAVSNLADAYRVIQVTPIVDDDYPAVRHRYESCVKDFIRAAKENGRNWK